MGQSFQYPNIVAGTRAAGTGRRGGVAVDE